MAPRNHPHLFVAKPADAEGYTPPPRKIPTLALPRPQDPGGHARGLLSELENAAEQGRALRVNQEIRVDGVVPGIYVTFESFPGLEMALERLDPRVGRVHPELVSVQVQIVGGEEVELATVRIPDGKLPHFLKRVAAYVETADSEAPKNRELVDRISSIRLASLEALWTDQATFFPDTDDPVWWEVWLRRRDGQEVERLVEFARQAGITVLERTLAFPDRIVVLVMASRSQLGLALEVLDDLAELRRPRAHAEILAAETPADQAQWVEQLERRIVAAPAGSPAVCIVDTGVHRLHPLLSASLELADCHACDPAWHIGDHHGHGTTMAGLALYGDVGAAVLSAGEVRLRHGLESVKILPPVGVNPPNMYAAVTAQAARVVEERARTRSRVFSMAITAEAERRPDGAGINVVGRPTSWSASIDALAAGASVDVTNLEAVSLDEDRDSGKRLFVLSAGNIDTFEDDFLTRCDLEPIEDPAQAWNAVTVGAFTDLATIDPAEPGYEGWTPLAPRGEISPYSRTSVAFDRAWPAKPDIVLEGGNVARSPNGSSFDWPDSFQSLTTRRPMPDPRLLTVTRQTSAATAKAAYLAASIMADYPVCWPETVRALMVHSAEWTPAMRARFDGARLRVDKDALRRRYGMGVPSLDRATRSANDALTLVIQDVIHPFDDGHMREMHLHDLPWPNDVLAGLGEVRVRMRVTLSYFIEPNPARRGRTGRYRYQSHGLRFEVRHATESTEDFRKRINERALAEEEHRQANRGGDAAEWFFGPDWRASGSLQSDFWEGDAVKLASRGMLAVFPVTGWWKERPQRDHSERGARYSLVVSIETPGVDVDIWTPVAQQIGIPVEITT